MKYIPEVKQLAEHLAICLSSDVCALSKRTDANMEVHTNATPK